ncbi:hypothetical protein SALWKB2_1993 [Snodgrassella alvi wkB2]|nr:hypothetical protein SALWKB2_1993 [Snodgrassella alvi wkB2]
MLFEQYQPVKGNKQSSKAKARKNRLTAQNKRINDSVRVKKPDSRQKIDEP